MSAILKRITARAKQIRKRKPAMQWKNAIKEAARELRGKAPKSKTVKRKSAPHKKARKKHHTHWGVVSEHERRVSGVSISGLKSQLRDKYKERLAKALLSKDLAKKKMDK